MKTTSVHQAINREDLYRFPWSKVDNPGGWIEVTDSCDLTCKGCYRYRLEGHRSIEKVKEEVLQLKEFLNCDAIAIAGGEPLIYPGLLELIEFISKQKLKPYILTNGQKLTPELVRDLKSAGLAKIHFHVDSKQSRENWKDKNEIELNDLRLFYADMVFSNTKAKIQSGFHTTVYRSTIQHIGGIAEWALNHMNKVQHLSFIAYRTPPKNNTIRVFSKGIEIEPEAYIGNFLDNSEDISITTEEMTDVLRSKLPYLKPAAFLNGSTSYETYKFLNFVAVGSGKNYYGTLGRKTIELAQVGYHFLQGRYATFFRNPAVGYKIFLMSPFDANVRKAFTGYLRACTKDPMTVFKKIYLQSIHLQQPNEFINGEVNLCDDCVNMMIYNGKLINSCRLDEYRKFGDLVKVIEKAKNE